MPKAATEPKVNARRETVRKRVPLAEQRDMMSVLEGKEDGYVYRWVNDVDQGQRIKKFEKAGYEVVDRETAQIGEPTEDDKFALDKTSTAARKFVGGGTHAVLMRTREDWYEEDQKAKQAKVDALEESMKQQALQQYGEGRNIKAEIKHPLKR